MHWYQVGLITFDCSQGLEKARRQEALQAAISRHTTLSTSVCKLVCIMPRRRCAANVHTGASGRRFFCTGT